MPRLIKTPLLNKKQYKVVFYVYLIIVLYLTLSPIKKIEPSFLEGFLFKGADKLVHTLLFLGFSVLCFLAYHKKYYHILILTAVIGFAIEVLQYLLPTGRSFDLMDWLFDLIGGVIGIMFIPNLSSINKLSVNIVKKARISIFIVLNHKHLN